MADQPQSTVKERAQFAALDQQVELLAPAGNWDCARAAVENGANAIYFGLDAGFNARARADNFHLDDLPELMQFLRSRNVRGYVTLNTLVFTDELTSLEQHVHKLAEAGVDAVLVQDLGVARLVREICPTLELHASTQMTLTGPEAIELARELGIRRAVLARELSIKEIEKISAATDMPLETFVHGALCVAYSGQCLTSESLGGRSANRGQCAQACRLPYDILRDGEQVDLGDQKYLLSPQDLAAHDYVTQLIDAGVCSLKIEGRLKTPEYVANVCSHYRRAIDEALAGRQKLLSETERRELELSFSRGFSPGWLEGCDHKRLVPGLSSSKRGTLLGRVVEIRGDELRVDLVAPVAPGDGIVISGDRFEGDEIGGRVYEIFASGKRTTDAKSGLVSLKLRRGQLERHSDQAAAIARGTEVYKTDDPQLTKRLRQSFSSADPRRRVPVRVKAHFAVGHKIRLEVKCPDSPTAQLDFDYVPDPARKHALNQETIQNQLGRLGGTVYELEDCATQIEGRPMVPLSVMGKLRKAMVAKLEEQRRVLPKACQATSVTDRLLSESASRSASALVGQAVSSDAAQESGQISGTSLRVLCRSLAQLEQVVSQHPDGVIADFHDIRQYRDAVRICQSAEIPIELATLRIHKPGEDGLFKAMHRHGGDRWLVRNLAAVRYCIDHRIAFACDFSMNVTNPITADQLLKWGAERVTASYDLNRDQLVELATAMHGKRLEVVVHQHMPMFHMEHCVFCSVLSPGKNKSDCGRPCDRHDVTLRDRVGAEHVLHADIGCRNTLYNGTAQSGAEAVAPLMQLGIQDFRVELLRDTDRGATERLIQLYRQLIAGEIDGQHVWRELKADNRIGVTRGTLEQPRNPLAIL
ncbi:MAG TPA: peptidase U32 [Planctomycetaceae bacterium]|nr:peptidase U32 [Planctomycetaceae bacterium]